MNDQEKKEKAERLAFSRPIDVHRWSDYPEVNAAVNQLFDEITSSDINPDGKLKRVREPEKLKRHIKMVVLDLYVASLTDPDLFIGYSRRPENYANKTRYDNLHINCRRLIRVVDGLKKLGYIENHKGFQDMTTGRGFQSRMKATEKLLTLIENAHKIRPAMVGKPEDIELIVLNEDDPTGRKTYDGKKIKVLKEYKDTPETIKMRENAQLINKRLSHYHIGLEVTDTTLDDINEQLKRDPDPEKGPIDFLGTRLYRVFNDNFGRGGRFYGVWWQNIPKEYRKYITINTKDTIELDYSGLHLNILYAENGLEAPDDPYSIKGIPESFRGDIKVTLNTILNAKSKQSAIKAIRQKLPDEKLPEGISKVEELIDKLEELHEPIKHHFYSDEGARLQAVDSQIAERVLLRMNKANAATLPVHDSFIVIYNFKDLLLETMEEVFKEVVGTEIGIKPKVSTRQERQKLHQQQKEQPDWDIEDTSNFVAIVEERKQYSKYYNRLKDWNDNR